MKKLASLFLILFSIVLWGGALADTVTIPAEVETIEAEAFYGDSSLDAVILPNGIKRIESLAFANSSLTTINLPDSLEFIADNAFDRGVDFDVAEGTTAYAWAERKGFISSDMLFLNKAKTVTFNNGDAYKILTFDPPETDYYTFYSNDEQINAKIYDNNHTVDLSNSLSKGFWLTAKLEKGTTYYLETSKRNQSGGSFQVNAKEADGILYVKANGNKERHVQKNESVTLKVDARSKEGTVSYQWAKGTREYTGSGYRTKYTDIEGATSSEYNFSATKTEDYRCYGFDIYGNWLSTTFNVYVDNQLSMYPENYKSYINVAYNEPATLTVVGSCNDGPITYQWYEKTYNENERRYYNTPIEGATGSTLTIEHVTSRQQFECAGYDAYENYRTVTFTVAIENHLTASAVGSQSIKVNSGSRANLKVNASCDHGNITYRWAKETRVDTGGDRYEYRQVTIEGATGNEYTTEAISGRENYYCIVSDDYGNTWSVYFNVSIENHLVVSPDEATRKVSIGNTATLTVNADCDTGNIQYQWRLEKIIKVNDHYEYRTTLLSDVTGNQYTTEPITGLENYYVNVTDDFGNAESVNFNISIENHLVASPDEATIKVAPGETTTLKINATCDNGDMTYQWQQEKRVQVGDNYQWQYNTLSETGNQYTTGPINGLENYNVTVRDEYGNSAYAYFNVNVDNNLQARAVSPTVYITDGKSTTLEVEASCNHGTLTYSWYDSNGNRVGDNSTSFVVGSAGNDNTYYHCVVTEPYGESRTVYFTVKRIQNILILGDNTYTIPTEGYPSSDGYLLPEQSGYYTIQIEQYTESHDAVINVNYYDEYANEYLSWDTEERDESQWTEEGIDIDVGLKADGSFYRYYYDSDFGNVYKNYKFYYACIFLEKNQVTKIYVQSDAGSSPIVKISYSAEPTELPEPNNQFIAR